jgi:hypothetical protein
VPDGLLDMLTWEPRAVELRLTSDGRVAHAGFAMGVNGASFAQLVDRRRIDPWVPLQLTAGGALQRLRGRAGPAAWRDSLAVLLGVLPRPELAEARSVLSARRSRFGGQRALALLVGGLIAEGQNTLAGSLLIWRNVCQVSSVHAPLVAAVGGLVEVCSGGEASGEVLDVGQSHMRGLATPGPWLRRWLARV